jgi:ankyrin repeat protein
MMKYLCEQGADKEARNNHGRTPLHWAAYNGHLPMVQYLCEQGADKEVTDYRGSTPIGLASRKPSVLAYLHCARNAVQGQRGAI